MTDIVLSLIVIAFTGGFIVLLLFFITKSREKREREIRDYCQTNGYHFSKSNGPLRKAIDIRSHSFLLTSTMVSKYHDAQTGSDSWEKISIWRTDLFDAERPSFLIGSVSASPGWDHLPPGIRDSAAQALADESGEKYTAEMASYTNLGPGNAVLIFQKSPGSADTIIKELFPLIAGCPTGSGIYLHSEPFGITVKCDNLFIRSLDDMKMLIGMGSACARRPGR